MKPADFDDFETVLQAFAALKGRQLTPPMIELYWRAMHDWDIAEFQAASVRLLKTCKFFPTPAEFEDLRRAGRETPGEAWIRAKNIARNLGVSDGQFQEASSDDPVLDAAVRAIGGYRALAMSTHDTLRYLESRFVEHYETIRDAEATRKAVPEIAGPVRHALPAPEPGAGANLLGSAK